VVQLFKWIRQHLRIKGFVGTAAKSLQLQATFNRTFRG
jgi:hypothetical protein